MNESITYEEQADVAWVGFECVYSREKTVCFSNLGGNNPLPTFMCILNCACMLLRLGSL